MKKPTLQIQNWTAALLAAVCLADFVGYRALASTSHSVEEETARIAKLLKPISDEDWANISGPHSSEKYEIVQGDTLYDISNRLFGDSKYWPKIWALNNSSITNPHYILPKNTIAFMPGTGTSLPAVAINQPAPDDTTLAKDPASIPEQAPPAEAPAAPAAPAPVAKAEPSAPAPASTIPYRRGVSQEWRKLAQQSWESVQIALPPNVDPDGFDKNSKIVFGKANGFELNAIPSEEKLESMGGVYASDISAKNLILGDTVYIESDKDLPINSSYALTAHPERLKVKGADRSGWYYPINGTVKIIAVHGDGSDRTYVGQITSSKNIADREANLIALPPRAMNLTPVPGSSAIEASLFVGKEDSTSVSVQHKQVYINRGSEDGVQPGMVFRAFQHVDPATGKKITKSDFIFAGDVMVTYCTKGFSAAVVLNSRETLKDGWPIVLLTDVSDVYKPKVLGEKTVEGASTLDGSHAGKDELDKLDITDNKKLDSQDQKELKDLENEKAPVEDNSGKELDALDQNAPPASDATAQPPAAEDGTAKADDLPNPDSFDSNADQNALGDAKAPGSADASAESPTPPSPPDSATGPSPASQSSADPDLDGPPAEAPAPPAAGPSSASSTPNTSPATESEDLPPPM